MGTFLFGGKSSCELKGCICRIDGIRNKNVLFVFRQEDVCEQSVEKDFLGERVCVHQTKTTKDLQLSFVNFRCYRLDSKDCLAHV